MYWRKVVIKKEWEETDYNKQIERNWKVKDTEGIEMWAELSELKSERYLRNWNVSRVVGIHLINGQTGSK